MAPRVASSAARWRLLCLLGLLAAGLGVRPLRAQFDLKALQAQAEGGDSSALGALGAAYASGQGVPQDYAKALQYFQRAADAGYAPALYNLGLIYESGRGAPRDPAAAFRDYLAAAKLGLAPAQFNVGNLYAAGRGVPADLFEAALWFRLAARQGLAEAQYNLALAYEEGRGLTKNDEEAQAYFRAAAAQGHARASYNLALMLENGLGSPADPAAAAKLYHAAALQGFGPAQNNYGILLAKGRGTPPNLPEAYAWLSLAVENGVAPENRAIIGRKLTPEQSAQAAAALSAIRLQIGHPGEAPEIKFVVEASPLPAAAPEGNLAATLNDGGELARSRAAAAQSASELAAVKEKLTQAEADREKTALDLSALTAQLQGARTANGSLAQSNQALLDSKNTEIAALKAERDRLSGQLKEVTGAKDELDQRNAELGRQLAQVQQTGQKDDGELVRARAEADALRAKQAGEETAAAKGAADLFAANQQLIATEQALVNLRADAARRAETAPPAAAPRFHVVQAGDSLVRISIQYYGTESRWQEIYAANRDVLEGEHSLKIGQQLRIP